ncbi:MAG: DUF3387 domain-containing protein [Candidatus Woesearchaeota archaeon]
MVKQQSNGANLGFEAKLWQAADKLRSNMDAAEYKHVVLGLIFLKYVSDAFKERYDALSSHVYAVQVLGDQTLKIIARELFESIKKNVKIDWAVKESVQAQMRVTIKRILKKYGYPPDHQAKATDLVLEQAKLLCADLVC